MSQKKVRFAVVGVRGLGCAHMQGIAKNSDVAELVAICDNDEEILNQRGEEYGVEKRYVDFYEMLKVGGFDCVILATPDYVHREHTVAVGLAAVESAAKGGMPVVPRYAKKKA